MAEHALTHEVGTLLLFEDDRTRVWLLDLAPGEATEWHEHDCDYAFVVTRPGTVQCEYVDGTVEHQRGARGAVEHRADDLGHRLVNVGDRQYQNIVVEFKRAT